MKKIFLLSCVIAISLLASSGARATLLGSASDYNAFIYGDMNVWTTDSFGRVAAGGNINILSYSVGSHASPADYSIVGGGNVTFHQGTVNNGGIFAGGNVELGNHGIYGSVTANGTVNFTAGGTITGSVNQNAGVAGPVDFGAEFDYLKWVSGSLSSMTANGTTTVMRYARNQITFTGTDDVNIFSLSGADLNNASNVNFNIGADDIAIVNVSGTIDNFMALGLSGYEGKQGNILYNFYEATNMTIQNIGLKGSVLAPYANVNFNSGHIDGTLIANSLSGSGEFHQYEFDHNVPVVPEPVSSILFIAGGATLGLRRLRKKNN
jgi:choice-of-anchor A domain-containing protein